MKKSAKNVFFNEKMINLRSNDWITGREYINLNHITRKKTFKLTAMLLAATMMFSSCIGSFRLTNKVKAWNEKFGDKWANELLFVAMNIVPVYSCAMFVDAVVLNSIEFWTGKKASLKVQVVKNSQGQDVEVTAMENGYKFTSNGESMNLVFNEEAQAWNFAKN